MIVQGDGDAPIEVRGEILLLLPERAVFWQRERALLIADPHWGKAATFRAGGIPVPSGTTLEAVTRLESIVSRTQAQKVYFLGDLLHAKAGRSRALFEALVAWRRSREAIDVVLVRGNHDRRAGDPPADLRFECVDAPWVRSPFILAHHPALHADGYVLAGHVHPGIRLYGYGGLRERLPCFVFGRDSAILPAFGDFTGLGDVEPADGQSIYAVAGDRVVSLTADS